MTAALPSAELEAGLRQGLDALGLPLSDAQIDALLQYHALLGKWTAVYNLTSVRAPQEMLTHHLLDSLAAVGPLRRHRAMAGDTAAGEAGTLLDVGSGGGLPGVVFAICCPELKVDCVDTVAKKAAFLQQAAATLRLSNLRGLHARVETIDRHYSVVSARAFASLGDFTRWSRSAVAEGGVWLAMKGKHPAEELAGLPSDVEVFHVEPLVVPGLEAERCIVWMRPQ